MPRVSPAYFLSSVGRWMDLRSGRRPGERVSGRPTAVKQGKAWVCTYDTHPGSSGEQGMAGGSGGLGHRNKDGELDGDRGHGIGLDVWGRCCRWWMSTRGRAVRVYGGLPGGDAIKSGGGDAVKTWANSGRAPGGQMADRIGPGTGKRVAVGDAGSGPQF